MRAYVLISGLIFGAIVIAHLMRVVVESSALATEPHFVLLTLLSASLALWAAALLWRSRRAT